MMTPGFRALLRAKDSSKSVLVLLVSVVPDEAVGTSNLDYGTTSGMLHRERQHLVSGCFVLAILVQRRKHPANPFPTSPLSITRRCLAVAMSPFSCQMENGTLAARDKGGGHGNISINEQTTSPNTLVITSRSALMTTSPLTALWMLTSDDLMALVRLLNRWSSWQRTVFMLSSHRTG